MSTVQPPIVFLDIDGVLLSTAAWGLPANVRLLAEDAVKQMSTFEFSERATLDPVAVMLINRLCHITGAHRAVDIVAEELRHSGDPRQADRGGDRGRPVP